MAVSTRLIRRRIRSIGNTRKITKAMELVAASKMRRAVQNTLSSRRYAEAGLDMILRLGLALSPDSHPLLAKREPNRSIVILITSHRGLAGGLNTNMLKALFDFFSPLEKKESVEFISVGKKGEEALRRRGKKIVASFAAIGDTPSFIDATPISLLVRKAFENRSCDRVFLAYTLYRSAISQMPVIRQLLPLSPGESPNRVSDDIIFEPSRESILSGLLPRMVDVQVYQALLEASASEHSARMLAMSNATDAASEMIDDLSFTFNQARQAAITREISEIAAGKAAIEA